MTFARLAYVAAAATVTIGMHALFNTATSAQEKADRSRVAATHALPALDGKHLEATVVEVTYDPGGANTAHRHPCPVIGYVLEGRLRMQVKGQPEKIYAPGDTFFETPSDVHVVSANASQDKPARFLAYFVCDRRTPLTVPAGAADEGR